MSHSPNNHNNPDIKANELMSRLNNGEQLFLLDVREPIEYHTYNIGGLNIPLGKLTEQIAQQNWNKTDEL